MAGSDVDFDAAEFRADIRATMLMGLPVDPAQRPIFHFPDLREASTASDGETGGEPLDWAAAAPVGDPPADPVTCGDAAGQVVCTWETFGRSTEGDETSMAIVNQDRLVLTMLDVDFALVEGFERVLMSEDVYLYVSEKPRIGLFDVTVHQIVISALDES